VAPEGGAGGGASARVDATLRARAWPSVAVVDGAVALCPHGLLSLDAVGAVLAFTEAVGPAQLALEDTQTRLVALADDLTRSQSQVRGGGHTFAAYRFANAALGDGQVRQLTHDQVLRQQEAQAATACSRPS
jgi:hypothetical protein